jgi:hypothetical protein
MVYDAQIQISISDIENILNIDFFNALSQIIEKKNYIMVIGPGAGLHLQSWNTEQPDTYWHVIFEAILSWCADQHVIEAQNVENEFSNLLDKDAWSSLGYLLEEYLSDKNEMQRCLKEGLQNVARSANLQLQLVRLPFCGFISTTYDIDIETAYEQIHHQQLTKFYGSSIQGIQGIQETCEQRQPFLLKLYGDIEHAESLIFGHRWSKGPTCVNNHALLHSLISTAPILFYGFNKDDVDYKYLKTVVDEHSPFKDASITISELEGQPQASEQLLLDKIDLLGDRLAHSPSNTSSNAICVPERNKPLLYNIYDNDFPQTQINYNTLTTVQNAPAVTELGGKGPIEFYTIYTAYDSNYYRDIHKYVFDTLKSLDYRISCHHNEVGQSNEWQNKTHLQTASLIFPLISLSFISSNIWKCEQMLKAIERQRKGDAHIIPILVQPADVWKNTTLGYLDALPSHGKAISKWSKKQSAYNDITNHIKGILDELIYEI